MITSVITAKHRSFLLAASAFALAISAPARAEDEAPVAEAPVAEQANGSTVYTPDFFARFSPRNALDMLNQVPGFQINQQDQGRGLGQASENVLINGERIASKSDTAVSQLQQITAARVVRIEIGDGASFNVPGLSGQVANVIVKGGSISGRFEYRAIWRNDYAIPSYGGGNVSVSGTSGNLEWTAAFNHGTGRGGAGGDPGIFVYDGDDNLIETREGLIRFKGEFPRLSGRVKWNGPNGLVANLSADYGWSFTKFYSDEMRHPVGDVGYFRAFLNQDDGYSYNISGDVDFKFGPGRLKLIGIERFNQSDGPATSILTFDDGRPDEGFWFFTDGTNGERIGRAEYRWDMLGGNWEFDAEAAFNRLDRIATIGSLDPDTGKFDIVDFPQGSGGVTEDRYEMILTHNRTLAKGLTLQIGGGMEYSKIGQTETGGVTREFWRPKMSANLAWTPTKGLDVSLKLARTVGQLSFGQFLATVDLDDNQDNSGNVELVPQQAWEADLEVKKDLGAWGSATVRGYYRIIEDYIDIIPVPGGESPGNIDGNATLAGLALNATINLDPLGWKGAKITTTNNFETSSLKDPLTGLNRPFSDHYDVNSDTTLRWDVPKSDWAFGFGANVTHVQPYVRLTETGRNWEGPTYLYGFIENKDVFGLTVNFNVFNPFGSGRSYNERFVYAGLRDSSPLWFREYAEMRVGTIYRIQVKGNF